MAVHVPAPVNNQQGWKNQLNLPARDERIKTEDVTNTKGNDFEDYFLTRELLRGIYEKGFEKPSPIQEESIPIALAGRDILARAKNGTGKTAAFSIPVIERIDTSKNQIQAVLLVPTRELAQQVAKQAARIYQATSAAALTKEKKNVKPIRALAVYGGVDAEAQKEVLLERQAQLLIATPGRLVDLLEWSLTLEEKQPKKKVKGAADQI